ncbi:MAG: S46 family peptidase [Tannerellaceae bacterium]|nr:S46 family peptidase [Tannerellaceae bacterium]
MKRLITLWALYTLFIPRVGADEGMWTLPLLKQQSVIDKMQALGLELQDYDLYNPTEGASSLKDAVIIFGGGCTGVVISPYGLMLTNHHCGYSQIQQHSTVEHDYLKEGFWAMTRGDELPNPGLSVTFIDRIEDVTAYVMSRLEADDNQDGMSFLSARYLNALAREKAGGDFLKTNPGTEVEIRPFYEGNQYYMFTRKKYTDVRLVGAPPSSVGKFGADTDNWMWPRHTGDFSLFRIYADANGNPAEYSPANVPLRPKRWMKISLDGIEDGDFAMMMGFPGRTNKYYTSWEVAERRDIDNAVRIHIRNLRQEAMLAEMLKDPALSIGYAAKYASSTNAYKNAVGSSWAISERNFEGLKRDAQDNLIAWSQKTNQPEYSEALRMLEQIVSDRRDLRYRSWVLDEALSRGIEFTGIPAEIEPVVEALRGKDKAGKREQLRLLTLARQRFLSSGYSPEVDRKIARVMLDEYRRMVPASQQPEYFRIIDKKFKGDTGRFIDYLFRKSIYGNGVVFADFVSRPSARKLERDPMILFAKAIQGEKKALAEALAGFDADFASERRIYVRGLLEMGAASFPDANSTLRLTYGQKRGYSPRDAVYYQSHSTLNGVIEKEDAGNWEFVVPARLKALYSAGGFSPYGMEDGGKMPVDFLITTHTTSGNSGSPVMNARGELIGLNFDRNWEGVGGDIQYLPDYQRSIIADIRYILFIIDRYAGASYLLEEMEIADS